MRLLLLVPIVFVAVAGIAIADWSDYSSSTLAGIEAEHRSCNDSPVDFHYETGSWKYTVRVVATGKTRQISSQTRLFIEHWAKSLGHGPDIIALFTHEVEVREASTVHWLPIQGSLVSQFESKVKAQDSVEFQIMLAGATGARWVFLVNRFQRLASPAV